MLACFRFAVAAEASLLTILWAPSQMIFGARFMACEAAHRLIVARQRPMFCDRKPMPAFIANTELQQTVSGSAPLFCGINQFFCRSGQSFAPSEKSCVLR